MIIEIVLETDCHVAGRPDLAHLHVAAVFVELEPCVYCSTRWELLGLGVEMEIANILAGWIEKQMVLDVDFHHLAAVFDHVLEDGWVTFQTHEIRIDAIRWANLDRFELTMHPGKIVANLAIFVGALYVGPKGVVCIELTLELVNIIGNLNVIDGSGACMWKDS